MAGGHETTGRNSKSRAWRNSLSRNFFKVFVVSGLGPKFSLGLAWDQPTPAGPGPGPVPFFMGPKRLAGPGPGPDPGLWSRGGTSPGPHCTRQCPLFAHVPGEPNWTTTPGVGFAWGGLKMPRQWCFHVGCGFSCVHGRTKGRGRQNLGTRNLVPTAEGHPVGVSGRSWAHFDGNWCGLDAGTTKDCARVDPGGRRPQTRGRCEIWRLRMAKSIFRTHRK